MKSFYPKPESLSDSWYVIDLKDQVLGRAVSQIAKVLMGKNKPTYQPSVAPRHFVVAINSDQIRFTGQKRAKKVYYHYTYHIGGIKSITADKLMKKDSRQVIEHATSGMLPKNKIGRDLLGKLKVYRGAEHPHQAQKPVDLKLAL